MGLFYNNPDLHQLLRLPAPLAAHILLLASDPLLPNDIRRYPGNKSDDELRKPHRKRGEMGGPYRQLHLLHLQPRLLPDLPHPNQKTRLRALRLHARAAGHNRKAHQELPSKRPQGQVSARAQEGRSREQGVERPDKAEKASSGDSDPQQHAAEVGGRGQDDESGHHGQAFFFPTQDPVRRQTTQTDLAGRRRRQVQLRRIDGRAL